VAGPAARAELGPAVGLAFALFALELPASALDMVFGAVRAGVAWNGWTLAGHAVSLLAVAAAMSAGGGLPALVGAWSGARLAVVLASGAWLLRHRPALRFGAADVDLGVARALSRAGGWFFLIQIAALVLYSTDNLVIAGVLGAEAVTPYAVAWRLFTLPSLGMAVAFPYLWPAYAEALAAGDRAWALRALRASVIRSAVAGALLALPLVAFGPPLIAAWAGPAAVPSRALLLWMGAWSFLLSWMGAVACFLNAAGRLRVQAVAGLAAAAANLLLSIAWARRYGVEGVIAATVVVYCVAIVPTSVAAAWRTVRRLRAA
jgi:O-antigen/teichoic acid export membrane protein